MLYHHIIVNTEKHFEKENVSLTIFTRILFFLNFTLYAFPHRWYKLVNDAIEIICPLQQNCKH